MAWLNAFKQPSTAPENRSEVPYLLRKTSWLGWFLLLGITQSIPQAIWAEPGWSAEQVVIHYGSFRGAISLDDLEASLEPSGQKQTAWATSTASLDILTQLEKLLTQPLPFLPPAETENLFRSPAGRALLTAVADVVLVSESSEQGAEALRTALVSAAASEQAFTGLNVLRHFPDDVHLDARQTMALLQQQKALQWDTDNFLLLLDQSLVRQGARPEPQGYEREITKPWEREDLRLPGAWIHDQVELKLWDQQRDRRLVAQLYLPRVNPPGIVDADATSLAAFDRATQDNSGAIASGAIPLLVMSHGLAANRHSRSFLAAHLASHGIAVAMLQHPGSDSKQFDDLLQGRAENIATAQSFIDRPQDVSFLLDELHRLVQAEQNTAPQNIAGGKGDRSQLIRHSRVGKSLVNYPLALEQVAVFGHSFGAYTALALAGAEINFAQLRQDCQPEAMLLDFSLVLQCQALALEGGQPLPPLQDRRVTALMLADPVSRSIFGPEELGKVALPVVWNGGDRDHFTPLMTSQLPSFQWLGSGEKHLAITEATSHVYLTPQRRSPSDGSASVSLTERVTLQPQVVQDYTNALGLAFARTYLHREERYRAYLTASYGQQLSQAPYHLRFWSSTDAALPTQLVQVLSEQAGAEQSGAGRAEPGQAGAETVASERGR